MKIIKVQSIANVIFGVLDEDGDVIQTQPFEINLGKLTRDNIEKFLETVEAKKAELEKQVSQ